MDNPHFHQKNYDDFIRIKRVQYSLHCKKYDEKYLVELNVLWNICIKPKHKWENDVRIYIKSESLSKNISEHSEPIVL